MPKENYERSYESWLTLQLRSVASYSWFGFLFGGGSGFSMDEDGDSDEKELMDLIGDELDDSLWRLMFVLTGRRLTNRCSTTPPP